MAEKKFDFHVSPQFIDEYLFKRQLIDGISTAEMEHELAATFPDIIVGRDLARIQIQLEAEEGEPIPISRDLLVRPPVRISVTGKLPDLPLKKGET